MAVMQIEYYSEALAMEWGSTSSTQMGLGWKIQMIKISRSSISFMG